MFSGGLGHGIQTEMTDRGRRGCCSVAGASYSNEVDERGRLLHRAPCRWNQERAGELIAVGARGEVDCGKQKRCLCRPFMLQCIWGTTWHKTCHRRARTAGRCGVHIRLSGEWQAVRLNHHLCAVVSCCVEESRDACVCAAVQVARVIGPASRAQHF